ncbi:MAG: LacI family DNA-binding transcriptional regulator [Chloroflexi bacterium]|nr:LacI family DNA-binding transcriptional regulator [Chloroflexota bacterium]
MSSKVTIYDIAREAQVSVATVSRILTGSAPVNPETKEKVEAVLQKYAFRPNRAARNLSYQRSTMIGVILPDITNPFFSTLFAEMQRHAIARDYSLLLFNAMNNLALESDGLAYLSRHQVDGLIFLGGRVNEVTPPLEYQKEIAAVSSKVPTVIVNGSMPNISAVTICTDEQSGIAQVVDYLAGLGHRRIAFLGGSDHITVTRNRQHAFREEVARLGLTVHDHWLITDGFSIESGEKAMEALLEVPDQPTAVIAINDLVALGILKAARRHHIDVPRDLSLVGFDDVYLTSVSSPELTSVSHNYEAFGRVIVETIIKRIKSEETPSVDSGSHAVGHSRLLSAPCQLTPPSSFIQTESDRRGRIRSC